MKIFDNSGNEKNIFLNTSSMESFRSVGGVLNTLYIAGQQNCLALTTGAPSGNALRAIPFVAPSRGAVIDILTVNVTTALHGSGIMGVYNNTSPWILYPSGLIGQGIYFQTGSTGAKSSNVAIKLDPGQLYWIVYWNTSAATLRSLALGGCSNYLGLASSLTTTPTVGWSYGMTLSTGISFPMFNLPSNFPLGASPIIAVPVPGLFYRYSL